MTGPNIQISENSKVSVCTTLTTFLRDVHPYTGQIVSHKRTSEPPAVPVATVLPRLWTIGKYVSTPMSQRRGAMLDNWTSRKAIVWDDLWIQNGWVDNLWMDRMHRWKAMDGDPQNGWVDDNCLSRMDGWMTIGCPERMDEHWR